MKRYIEFVVDHPVAVVAAVAAITAVLSLGLFRLRFDSSLDSMMPTSDSEYLLNEEIKEIFGNNGKFIVLCLSASDVINTEFLEKAEMLHQDIEEYESYREEREKGRLEKIRVLAEGDGARFEDIVAMFGDDPVFQRYLGRKRNILFPSMTFLSAGDLRRLALEIERSVELKRQGLVDMIISPFTMQDVKGENDALVVYDLVERNDRGERKVPSTKEELEIFRARLTNNPAFRGGIFSVDRKTGAISSIGVMIRLKDSPVYDPVVDEVREIAGGYSGISVIHQGLPVIYHAINNYMKSDLIRMVPVMCLVVIIMLYLNFRTVRGVVLPFLTLVLADLWILGLMGHLGFNITIVGIALPPLMIMVGSSYSIHVLNRYYLDMDDITRLGRKEGLKKSVSMISVTVILAGVTTVVGFLTLATNQVSSIREWGIFSGIGVVFAMFISLSLIPAVFVLLPHRVPKRTMDEGAADAGFSGRFLAWTLRLSLGHPRAVIAVSLVLLAVAGAGIFRTIVETSIHSYFREGDYILTSSRTIGEKFGGALSVNVIIDSGEEDGVKDPRFLNAVERFREWAAAEENADLNVGRTDAFGDFIKTFNLAMNDNDARHFTIPERKINVESYIDLFSGDDMNDDGRIDAFESYVDRDYRTANVIVRVWEKQGKLLSTADFDHTIRRIERYLRENLPEGYTFQTSGEPKIIVRLANYVVKGQVLSLGFSLALVFLIVVMLLKNWTAGLVSLVPIGMAVVLNFGVMGWFGIRLDLATAIIASLAVGIGIDNTIHFLNFYRHFLTQGLDADAAVRKTIMTAGKAMVYTALALVCGFLVFVTSNFRPITLFGVLGAVTIFASTLGALVVLPAVIRVSGISLEERVDRPLIWRYFDLGRFFEM